MTEIVGGGSDLPVKAARTAQWWATPTAKYLVDAIFPW